jgi:hypothetical protein
MHRILDGVSEPFARLITEDSLARLAGERSFARGLAYFESGAVSTSFRHAMQSRRACWAGRNTASSCGPAAAGSTGRAPVRSAKKARSASTRWPRVWRGWTGAARTKLRFPARAATSSSAYVRTSGRKARTIWSSCCSSRPTAARAPRIRRAAARPAFGPQGAQGGRTVRARGSPRLRRLSRHARFRRARRARRRRRYPCRLRHAPRHRCLPAKRRLGRRFRRHAAADRRPAPRGLPRRRTGGRGARRAALRAADARPVGLLRFRGLRAASREKRHRPLHRSRREGVARNTGARARHAPRAGNRALPHHAHHGNARAP